MSGEIYNIEIRRVAAEAIIDLRHRILRKGYPRDSACFKGDDGPDAVHVAAYLGDGVIGCATVLLNEWEGETAYQLRGMAVDAGHQKLGIGRKLLEEIENAVMQTQVRLMWANARTPASGFYRKLGWEIVSEQFEIPTAGPHFKIVKRLVQSTND